MRDYGKVHSTFWSSATTGRMSDDGKLLALYLLTCSHSTIAGVFRLPDGYVSEDLGWPLERVAEGFGELFDNGFANRCETTKWAWIVKHLEWNPPENPNQRKSAAKVARSVPDECSWKSMFMRTYARLLEIPLAQEPNPCETLRQPFLNQELKQEQEREISPEPETVSEPPVVSIPLVDGSDFGVDAKQVAEWSAAFPAVDVAQQLREMRVWCIANQDNRKTRRGVQRFCVRWLGKAQDTAQRLNGAHGSAPAPKRSSTRPDDPFLGAV